MERTISTLVILLVIMLSMACTFDMASAQNVGGNGNGAGGNGNSGGSGGTHTGNTGNGGHGNNQGGHTFP